MARLPLLKTIETSPLNTEPDGTCRTIKAQYAQSSYANFVRGGTFGASGARNEQVSLSRTFTDERLRQPPTCILDGSVMSYTCNIRGGGKK